MIESTWMLGIIAFMLILGAVALAGARIKAKRKGSLQ
jgi:hypothetical protein